MRLHEKLDALRLENSAVEIATYLDIGSGTVLYASSSARVNQEILDNLCETVKTLLGEQDKDSNVALALRSTEALIVCRSSEDPSEAICLVCAPDVDVSSVLAAAEAAWTPEKA